MIIHNFDTAFKKYASHLSDNLRQSASSREFICRQVSGEKSGYFVLRGIAENDLARVSNETGKVTLAPFNLTE